MAPSDFSIRLQYGITGGFAPPTPSSVHTFTKSAPQTQLFISTAVRPDGTPHLSEAVPRSISYTDEQTVKLMDELYEILKTLPMEKPAGSEDIYGLDTSIAWGSDDMMWINGGPQGCGGGISDIQATDEEKAKFKRAVDIAQSLVDKAHGK